MLRRLTNEQRREIRFIPSTRSLPLSVTNCRSEVIPLRPPRQPTGSLSQQFPTEEQEETSHVTTKCALDDLIELYRAKCFKLNTGRGKS